MGLLSIAVLAVAVAFGVASSQQCGNVYPHLSCGLEVKDSEELCLEKGCCWDPDPSALNRCFAPVIHGYDFAPTFTSQQYAEGVLHLNEPSGLKLGGPDYTELKLEVTQETESRTHIKIFPSNEPNRWEIPESILPRQGGVYEGTSPLTQWRIFPQPDDDETYDSTMLILSRTNQKRGVNIGGEVVFTMTKMLVFQDQYIQMVLGTPSQTIATFGFGESSRLTQHLEMNTTYTLWNTDCPAAEFNKTLYGSHPFFVQVSSSGEAHGVLFLNSNAMDVTTSTSSDQGDTLSIQAIGGVIDLYIFAGPTPESVIKQYLETLNIFPAMVPRWSLGFHNCRWGYEDIGEVEDVVKNYSQARIPLEAQWLDIDYMERYLDFTLDGIKFPQSEMTKFVDSLHANQQYFVPIVDPAISIREEPGSYPPYDQGISQNVFIKDMNGVDPYLGQVWPGPALFPDFFAENTSSYWQEQLKCFYQVVDYDGIWVDMNEASNFCNYGGGGQVCELRDRAECDWNVCCLNCSTLDSTNPYDFPVYVPHTMMKTLGGRTLPMSALLGDGVLNYNAHNLYGLMESMSTYDAVSVIRHERPFVLSRSTFVGSGKYAAHWTGDNAATWLDLKASIVTMNNMALFGIPMTGADICGFQGDTSEELCTRWIEVGAFSPFSRDHNIRKAAPQELYRWSSVAAAARSALNLRYRLLPHLYTLMYKAHKEGKTVHNAMWMHFPQDSNTFFQDGQYMWSNSILFTPVLEPGEVSVTAYFPEGVWYSLYDESCIHSSGEYFELSTPLLSTNVHVRGGSIIPMQDPGMTTMTVSSSPFSLLVALPRSGESSGSLFFDDGKQLQITEACEIEYTTITRNDWNVLFADVVLMSIPQSDPVPHLGTIEVLTVELPSHQCDGFVVFPSADLKVTVSDVDVAVFESHSRVKFVFEPMVPVEKSFKFYWQCL